MDRYATSWSQQMMHSTNGGVSFSGETLPTTTPGDPFALAFLGGDVYGAGLWGALVRRDAAAGTWSAVTHPAGMVHLTALHARSDGKLLIGGRGGELMIGDAAHGFTEQVHASTDYMVGVALLGPGKIAAARSDGTVFYSSDGGMSFASNFNAKTYVTALAFGDRLYLTGIEGEFWTSDDGGASFQSANRPSVNSDELTSVWADAGGRVAVRQGGTGYVFLSKDSGQSWTQSGCSGSTGGDGSLIDGNGILYIGQGYAVCRAALSSATLGWNSVYVGAEPKQFFAAGNTVFFVSTGCAVGRSTDQGLSWTVTTPPAHPYSCSSLWGSSLNDLYIAGQAGEILHSTDGGMSWSLEETASGVGFFSISGSGPGEVVAVGSDGAILVRK
jgi:photosystem II stability/assembly factor-like uncharacterized protein